MQTLDTRLAALERAGRRQRCAIAILGSALAAIVLTGTAQPVGGAATPDVVKAKRFEVVTDSGAPVLVMTRSEAGGLIGVQTAAGQLLVTISATPDGAGLIAVADKRGGRLVEISGKAGDGGGGVGMVNTFNPQGEVAVSLLSSKGQGMVQTFNSRKNPAAMLGGVNDEGVIAVFDAAGKVRQTIPADK